MSHLSAYFPVTDPTLVFFVVLCIILFAPIIMGKLRIPHIIKWACTILCSLPAWRWTWRD